MHSPKAEMDKELNKHLQVNRQVTRQNPFVGDASRQVISSGTAQCHHTAPNVGKKDTFLLNVPKRTRGLAYHNHQQDNHELQWTHSSLTQATSASTVVAITDQLFAPHGHNINQTQVLQVMYPVQVSLTVICLLNRAPKTARSMMLTLLVNNPTRAPRHDTDNNIPQVTPQVNPNVSQQHNFYMPNVIPPAQMPNQFLPPPYFPIPFPLPPVTPCNVSAASSAPASDLSAAITLMTNAVNQGNSNTTAIMDALQRTTTQFVDALQQTIQMGVDAQAEEIKNARLDKQFDKIKIFDGSDPSACHPWLEEVHALCTQTGRSFREMLLLCAGQAV